MDSAMALDQTTRTKIMTNITAVEVIETVEENSPSLGLVVRPSEGRSWDFRPFGQSEAVRKHRVVRSYLRINAWKIACGMLSRRVAKKAAKKFADRAVADDPVKGCRCAVRMGSRTWLAIL